MSRKQIIFCFHSFTLKEPLGSNSLDLQQGVSISGCMYAIRIVLECPAQLYASCASETVIIVCKLEYVLMFSLVKYFSTQSVSDQTAHSSYVYNHPTCPIMVALGREYYIFDSAFLYYLSTNRNGC